MMTLNNVMRVKMMGDGTQSTFRLIDYCEV